MKHPAPLPSESVSNTGRTPSFNFDEEKEIEKDKRNRENYIMKNQQLKTDYWKNKCIAAEKELSKSKRKLMKSKSPLKRTSNGKVKAR